MKPPFVVMKFGGTSVASAEGWKTISRQVSERSGRHRVILVCSALAGVTDQLLAAIEQAKAGEEPAALRWIEERHAALAVAGGAGPEAISALRPFFESAEQRLQGIRLTGEASPRLTALVLATGELACTTLGRFLLARSGVQARWIDARELVETVSAPRASAERRYLEASARPLSDPARVEQAASDADVVLTQGFIARTKDGETCLLGRGGSDTSGAVIAELAGAARLEIWTDVPGLFTANPREVPSSRLIRHIGYREARELATLGAKVLHPPCLVPVERARIPVHVQSTLLPDAPGTIIEPESDDHPAVTAVTGRRGVTLLTLSTVAMWDVSGFLARTFAPFEELGISVDLVGTSQAAVSITIDRLPGGMEGEPFRRLLERLRELGEVRVVHPCAVVSIVGRRIRSVLPELGGALAAFAEKPVHLVSDSSEDLNLSFVVDEEDGAVLVQRLHQKLMLDREENPRLGPTWEELRAEGSPPPASETDWWRARRTELLEICSDGDPRYVYHLPTVRARAEVLRREIPSVDRFFYSMKANPHPRILEVAAAAGFGIECVSAGEIRRAREVLGESVPLLFTPNFCPVSEFEIALKAGAEVTLDGPQVLALAPALFRGVEIGLRIDPGFGLGHHEKVHTGGAQSKFGQPLSELHGLLEAASAAGTRVAGLHAHIGSGVFDPSAWTAVARALGAAATLAGPSLRWLDLGGGLGVPERPGQPPLDLAAVEASLRSVRAALGPVELRMEPGRFLVSEAGVLVAPVTQIRRKGDKTFVGAATGMNSLIRPALYGAWHHIVNLSRLEDPTSERVQVVGPICESADVLGRDRWLPATRSGDVLLIACAGAYGAAMASRYNLREPAAEVILDVLC